MAYSIVRNERPTRPENETTHRWLPDLVWDTIQGCWGGNPQSRLSLRSLHQTFVRLERGQKENAMATGNGKSNVMSYIYRLVLKNHFQVREQYPQMAQDASYGN